MKYFAIFALFFLPTLAEAATLTFSAERSATIGDEFPVYVYVDSEEQGFNAVEASISFPPEKLQVLSVDLSTSASVLNYWLTNPTFSNEAGTITFAGGTTKGTTGRDIPILKIMMRAVGTGDVIMTASDASINASDGRGTNILEEIEALRLIVSASIIIPPKETPPPTPAKEEERLPISILATAPEVPAEIPSQVYARCVGIFSGCDLQYPIISNVVKEIHTQVGAHLTVSGTAEEGSHVHVLLDREGVFYKEIIIPIEFNKAWEVVFANIYEYGTYNISAWASEETTGDVSTTVTWNNIQLYPPFTIHPFGIVIRWYAMIPIVLGGILVLLLIPLLVRHLIRRRPFRTDRLVIVYSLTVVVFLISVGVAYVFWQKEYRSETAYWKNTDIECVLRGHSWIDFYGSAQLFISVDGVPQEIPARIGFSPNCVSSIHTHDNTGRIHFKINTHALMFLDFFIVAGIPFEQEGYTISGTLNSLGMNINDLRTHKLEDGDIIELEYTKIPSPN